LERGILEGGGRMERMIEDSWLAELLRYTSGQETPELFYIFSGIALISAVLNRDVKMDKVYFDLYPNVYIILIAGTSKCHKSQSIGITTSFLDEINNPPRKFAQKITNERLIQFLSENIEVADMQQGLVETKASGIIAADELSSFLGKNAMDTGIITTLTDLYGSQKHWEYQTKGSGTDVLNNVYITFLGASTAKWLRSAIPQEAVGGGFISRCIFVYQEEPKRLIPFPEDERPDNFSEIKKRLVHDLNCISQMKGIFELTPDAKSWYREWYKNNAKWLQQTHNEDFFSRWDTFMFKLGMIISAARSNELLVTTADLQMADMYLQTVKDNMNPVLNTLTTAESELPTAKVLELIERRTSVNHEALMKMTKHMVNAEGLQLIIQTLEEAGDIEVVLRQGEPKKYIYRGEGDN